MKKSTPVSLKKPCTVRAFMYYLKYLKLTYGKLERLYMASEHMASSMAADRDRKRLVDFYKAALAQKREKP